MTSDRKPILLFNDECGVCRRIAGWVLNSANRGTGGSALTVQPIGDDPSALRSLNAELDIWDAYATIHLLLPDGSMKVGGDAVAEVLRRLPDTAWFAWLFALGFGRFRPFQWVLDLGYTVLAGVRPIFGCESCGAPSGLLAPFVRLSHVLRGHARHPVRPHFSARAG